MMWCVCGGWCENRGATQWVLGGEGVVCVGSVASREVPRSCPICHKVISNFYNLKKHITTMHQAPVHYHACAHCTAAFRTPEYLRKHLVNVHKYPVKKKK
ncbi:hypothetical protein Pmani_031675 [Petrolisthes manimaculis]|uniref:C2H2-type domain-containing protein n=1 Tax=Petrolisthes manimaculis TaxID=1843537 RepID=A0AAE1TRS0_9EUCA|nr:hypothetical protein Pmani_031675 [Petrolisthes manimaculis]